MRGKTSTAVVELLEALPPDRRREFDQVRTLIREHIPAGYEEVVSRR